MILRLYIFINFFLLLYSGCSFVKSEVKNVCQAGVDTINIVKYKILPKEEEPKKKVLITPFICAWDPSSKYGDEVAVNFAKKLRKMSVNLLVYLPKNPSSWKIKGPIPHFGIINVPEFVKDASQLHMNYLITGVIDVMEVEKKTNGVWPFRHFDQVFEAVMVVNIIDTVTGALVESHMESEKFAMPVDKISKDQNESFIKVLKNTVPALIRSQVILVAKVLKRDIWKSRIIEISANPGKIKIDAGKDVGIKEGMILKVFSWGKRINPPNSPSFYCLGKEIGKIKVTLVNKNYSIAVPLNKADYHPGLPVVFD